MSPGLENKNLSLKGSTLPPQASSVLTAEHIEHLRSEGFTDAQIKWMQSRGVRSLTQQESESMGFKVRGESGNLVSSSGLYFAFTESFGQIRCDDLLIRENGSIAKYLTPGKAQSQAWIPDRCKVITEGYKDAAAGTLHGNIPTGALAGVSHYRKALKAGEKYTFLFDSDGWDNPQVIANLLRAGFYLNGKIQLVPKIEGHPKAGLCEYFKAGHTAEDYKALIGSAMKPEEFILEMPNRIKDLKPGVQMRFAKILTSIAAENLSRNKATVDRLIGDLAKSCKLTLKAVRVLYFSSLKRLKSRDKKKSANPATENKFAIPIKYDKQGEPKLTPASAVANILIEKYRSTLAFNTEDKNSYRYEAEYPGIWGSEPEEFVKQIIQAELNATPLCSLYGATYINSIFQLMQNALSVRRWNEVEDLLPMANGVLDLKTGKLLEHSPGYRLTWRLPYAYDPTATCEPIIQWLKDSQDNDMQRVQLLRAYLKAIVCGRTDLQRLMECIGPGGTGKSTYTRLGIGLVGLENTFITELKHLEQNRFETSGIYKKRLILISDSERYGGNITVLKALSGQDPVRFEEKNKQQRTGFICQAMIIIAANEAIQSADYTSGLERRRITVPFLNQVAPSKRKDLLTIGNAGISGEFVPYLPGLLNWVLALPDDEMVSLLLNTQLSVPSLQRWKAESLIESNPIAEWLENCVVYDPDPETKTYVGVATRIRISQGDAERSESWEEYEKTNDWLYANYCEFTGYAGSKPVSLKRFVTLLEDLCRSQLRLDVQRRRDENGSHFVGLAIRSSSSIYEHHPKIISELFATPATQTVSTQSEESPVESDCQQVEVQQDTQLTVQDWADKFKAAKNDVELKPVIEAANSFDLEVRRAIWGLLPKVTRSAVKRVLDAYPELKRDDTPRQEQLF